MKRYLKLSVCLCMAWMFLWAGLLPDVPVSAGTAGSKPTLNRKKVTLTKGKTVQLKITNKSLKGKKVKWVSSKKTVASVSSKGKVKAKAKGKAKITATVSGKKAVCVVTVKSSAKASATEKPASGDGQAQDSQGGSLPSESSQPGAELATASPKTLDSSVLVASSKLVTVGDTLMTAYVINKKFSGDIHMSFNGKEYTTSGKGKTILSLLAKGATTKENHDGTIRVSRSSPQEEYWTVEDLSLGRTYYMKATTDNTVDTSVANCGVIYVVGDVLSEVQIY